MKSVFKILVFFLLILKISTSCEEEEYITSSTAKLEFSTDTVWFDTIFNEMGTITKRIKVYNRHNNPIKISSISLGNNTKNFRLNIDGLKENSAKDIEILKKDSIYIFIEMTTQTNNQNTPVLTHDSIVFETNGNIQDVDLLTVVQDVNRIRNHITSNTVWQNDKPYLIMDSLSVDAGQTLKIEAGCRIHFMKNTALNVFGKIEIEGNLNEKVVIQGLRFDNDGQGDDYFDIPGQWKGIHIYKGSENNKIDYAKILNANIGIALDSTAIDGEPVLKLSNTEILHHSFAGIAARSSRILATNCLIAHCGSHCIKLELGGSYDFYHSTITPIDWRYSYNENSVEISNIREIKKGGEVILTIKNPLRKAYFYNSIIWGNVNLELKKDANTEFNFKFHHCLLKCYKDDVDETNFINCKINPISEEFGFLDYENYNYQLDTTLTVAKNTGDLDIITQNPQLQLELDLNGNNRIIDKKPDIGAYEVIKELTNSTKSLPAK